MSSEPIFKVEDASKWVTYYERTRNGKVVYSDQWETAYGALIDDEGKKIPTPQVPVAEIDGTYLGPTEHFSTLRPRLARRLLQHFSKSSRNLAKSVSRLPLVARFVVRARARV